MARERHGHTSEAVGRRSPTYASWCAMISRCICVTDKQYADYGGRGIRVCARWTWFENFLADMGERPAGTTLDRKNNEGDYEHENCRWATPADQARNRRNTKLSFVAVALIREFARRGATESAIAHAFGVHQSTVSRVVAGRMWRSS
jgi:hypothetical protein